MENVMALAHENEKFDVSTRQQPKTYIKNNSRVVSLKGEGACETYFSLSTKILLKITGGF